MGIRKKKTELAINQITFSIAEEVIFLNTFAETETLLKTAINVYKNGGMVPHHFCCVYLDILNICLSFL